MILVLSDLWIPFPGGAERLMFNLARYLMRFNLDVHVLTGYENAKQFDGPNLTVLPIQTGVDHDLGWRMVEMVIDKYKPDVILTHHHYAFEFERELVATGIPLVQVVLNGRRIEESAFAVYISEWVRDTVGGSLPDDMVITPPAFADVVSETHGDMIGFIKPIPHKGIDMLYRIAVRMRHKQFLVLRGEWQTLEDIRPRRNVEFMEPVDDMRDFYSRCRLLLVPSTSEDAGTVAQEATMNGLACISSDVGGLVETNGGGIRLSAHDVKVWVNAIRRLDVPAFYAQTVAHQQQHLDSLGHGKSLAEFTFRVCAL